MTSNTLPEKRQYRINHAVYGKQFNDKGNATDWRIVKGTKSLIDDHNLEKVIWDLIFHPADNRRDDRTIRSIPIYNTKDNSSFAAIDRNGIFYFLHISTYAERNRDGGLRFIIPQVHIYALPTNHVLQLYSDGFQAFSSFTEHLVSQEHLNKNRSVFFNIPLSADSKYTSELILNIPRFDIQTSDIFSSPIVNRFMQKSLIEYIGRIWLALHSNKKIAVTSHNLNIIDMLRIIETLQYLFALEDRIISFSYNNMCDYPVDILILHDKEKEIYQTNRYLLDLTSDISDREKLVIDLITVTFSLEWNDSHKQWRNIAFQIKEEKSLENTLFHFQKTTRKFELQELINHLHNTKDLEVQDIVEIIENSDLLLISPSENTTALILQEGIKSVNASYVDACWQHITKKTFNFDEILKWYCYSNEKVTYKSLAASARTLSFETIDIGKLDIIAKNYPKQFTQFIRNIVDTPLIFNNNEDLLGLIVKGWSHEKEKNSKLLSIIQNVAQENKLIVHALLKRSTEVDHFQPQIVLEYASYPELGLKSSQKIEYRNLLIKQDEFLSDSRTSQKQIVEQFVNFSLLIKSEYKSSSEKRIGLSIRWFQAFQQSKSDQIIRDALFYQEIPLLLIRGLNNQKWQNEVSIEIAEKEFQNLIPHYITTDYKQSKIDYDRLREEINSSIMKMTYRHQMSFFILKHLFPHLEKQTRNYKNLYLDLIYLFHNNIDNGDWRRFFKDQLGKITETIGRRDEISLRILAVRNINMAAKKEIISVLADPPWQVSAISAHPLTLNKNLLLALESQDGLVEFIAEGHTNLFLGILDALYQSQYQEHHITLDKVISQIKNNPKWLDKYQKLHFDKNTEETLDLESEINDSENSMSIRNLFYLVLAKPWLAFTLCIILIEILSILLIYLGIFDGLIKKSFSLG